MKTQTKVDPFLLRAIAKAAVVLCYQPRRPLTVPASLWTTAAGLPITAANWRRLQRLKLLTWSAPGWQLTPEGARLLRGSRIVVPAQIVSRREGTSP